MSWLKRLKPKLEKRRQWVKDNPGSAEFLRKKRVREYYEKKRNEKIKELEPKTSYHEVDCQCEYCVELFRIRNYVQTRAKNKSVTKIIK